MTTQQDRYRVNMCKKFFLHILTPLKILYLIQWSRKWSYIVILTKMYVIIVFSQIFMKNLFIQKF